MKPIPFKKKLPKEPDIYLVWNAMTREWSAQFLDFEYNHRPAYSLIEGCLSHGGTLTKLTHWMPMPDQIKDDGTTGEERKKLRDHFIDNH